VNYAEKEEEDGGSRECDKSTSLVKIELEQ
jgi:hypothetical protein